MNKYAIIPVLLALIPFSAFSVEPGYIGYPDTKFNALDATDAAFPVYQQNLCMGTFDAMKQFHADVLHLGRGKVKLTDKAVADYVIAKTMYEKLNRLYAENCQQ